MARSSKGERGQVLLRCAPALLSRVDAFAERCRMDRTESLVALLEAALDADDKANGRAPGALAPTHANAQQAMGEALKVTPGRKAKAKPSASAPVREAAAAISIKAPTVRARPRKLVGFHPVTGEAIYTGGDA